MGSYCLKYVFEVPPRGAVEVVYYLVLLDLGAVTEFWGRPIGDKRRMDEEVAK